MGGFRGLGSGMPRPKRESPVSQSPLDDIDEDSDFDEELRSLMGSGKQKEPALPEVVVDVELIARKAPIGDQEVSIPCKSNNTFKEVKTMLAERLDALHLLTSIWLVHKSNTGVYVSFKDSDKIGDVREVLFLCARA